MTGQSLILICTLSAMAGLWVGDVLGRFADWLRDVIEAYINPAARLLLAMQATDRHFDEVVRAYAVWEAQKA